MKNAQLVKPDVFWALVLTGCLAFSSGLMASADPKMGHGDMDKFFDAVDATDTQEKQLEALHMQAMQQMRPLKETMMQRKQDLAAYILSPGATQEGALQREAQIQELRSQVSRIAIDEAFAKKEILTPEQQRKAAAFLQEQAQKMKGKMPPADD